MMGWMGVGIAVWLAVEVPVTPVDQAPVIDGSGKEACWEEAKEIQADRWTLKAVEHNGNTYVLLQYGDVQEPKSPVRRKDDPAVLTDERIEIAVMDRGGAGGPAGPRSPRGRSGEVAWRMAVTPQAVYDAKQTQTFVEEWTSDSTWESDVRVKVTGRRWDVEMTMPSSSRNVVVWRRGPKRTGDEPLAFNLDEEGGRRGRPWAGRQESREELEKRALEPATRERANRRVDFSEAVLKMWMDPALTYDTYWDVWQRAGEQHLGEGFADWRDSVARMRQDNPERSKEMFERRREAVAKDPSRFRQEIEVDRALINGESLGAFQAAVSSRTGAALPALKVLPGDVTRPGFSMGWTGGPAGSTQPSSSLSKGWQEITEEQYQVLRVQRLTWYAQTTGESPRGPGPRPGGRP